MTQSAVRRTASCDVLVKVLKQRVKVILIVPYFYHSFLFAAGFKKVMHWL